jgi:hypothetical protein
MDNHWVEFQRRTAEWQRAGDNERLQMARAYYEAMEYRESNPQLQFDILTRGRDEARRLAEPWWVLFFDAWRLVTLTSDLHDFGRALPLAMDLMLRFNGPEGRAHPQRVVALIDVLYCYFQIDPFGYRDELERGFTHLDAQVDKGATSDRFVLDFRRAEYLNETERWSEAHDLSLQSLARADASGDPSHPIWHGAWALFLLCPACHALGRMDQLAGHAEDMIGRSKEYAQLDRTRASGWLWLAVTQRAKGDERASARSFHQGMRHLNGVNARDEICAEPVARYYELGTDWKAAVTVRDRELACIDDTGSLHRICRVQIERCRILAAAGSLTPADLDAARQAAAKMRFPDRYLERIGRIGAP